MATALWGSWSDRGDAVRCRSWIITVQSGRQVLRLVRMTAMKRREWLTVQWTKESSPDKVISTLGLDISVGVWRVTKWGEAQGEAWLGRRVVREVLECRVQEPKHWLMRLKTWSTSEPLVKALKGTLGKKSSLFSKQWSCSSPLSKELTGFDISEHNQHGVEDRLGTASVV